ncbi:hypothetical protein CONPUDRAFT_145159 [Coniophora puteana RWD-64-598 SS2]|uniref:Uncharacterized protein n=1 Tax=Coniophora puteana (strain RWD-64-598) TaxID=741705 RepID=A0A5M3MK03_CONPW|nr:uncharacterized protein CONPUDRAFT_145159 [Coniophora puteana RWD-64-598 SS2]EIW78931.1 hypothetical protein CONPUDRAFT_145159 [Coniophora puteana RWD-64-598 SS2]
MAAPISFPSSGPDTSHLQPPVPRSAYLPFRRISLPSQPHPALQRQSVVSFASVDSFAEESTSPNTNAHGHTQNVNANPNTIPNQNGAATNTPAPSTLSPPPPGSPSAIGFPTAASRPKRRSLNQQPTHLRPARRARVVVNEGREAKRRKVITEFVDTEKSYVDGLDLIYSHFLTPIIASLDTPKPLLTRTELTAIFSNFIDIWNLHRSFYSALSAYLAAAPAAPNGTGRPPSFPPSAALGSLAWGSQTSLQTSGLASSSQTSLNQTLLAPPTIPLPPLSPLFRSHFPYLSLYTPFITSFPSSLSALTAHLSSSPQFAKFIRAQEAHPACGKLRLPDWLLTIVQRCPRYLLLLKDLIGCTDEADPERAALEDVRGLVEKITTSLNTSLHTHAQTLALLHLQRATAHLPRTLALVAPGRTLVKRGPLSVLVLPSGALRSHEFLLFNDCLVWLAREGCEEDMPLPPLGLSFEDDEEGDGDASVAFPGESGQGPGVGAGVGRARKISRPLMVRSRSKSEAELGELRVQLQQRQRGRLDSGAGAGAGREPTRGSPLNDSRALPANGQGSPSPPARSRERELPPVSAPAMPARRKQQQQQRKSASEQQGDERWVYRGHVALVDVEIVLDVCEERRIEVLSPSGSFAVYADSIQSSNDWTTALRSAKASLLASLNTKLPNSTLTSSASTNHVRRALRALPYDPALTSTSPSPPPPPPPGGGGDLRASASASPPPARERRLSFAPLLSRSTSALFGGTPFASSSTTNLALDAAPAEAFAASAIAEDDELDDAGTGARGEEGTGRGKGRGKGKRAPVDNFLPPVWIPDARTDACMRCARPFGWRYARRRHHCRLCGRCVCAGCSGKTFYIVDASDSSSPAKPARACNECYDTVFPVLGPAHAYYDPPRIAPPSRAQSNRNSRVDPVAEEEDTELDLANATIRPSRIGLGRLSSAPNVLLGSASTDSLHRARGAYAGEGADGEGDEDEDEELESPTLTRAPAWVSLPAARRETPEALGLMAMALPPSLSGSPGPSSRRNSYQPGAAGYAASGAAHGYAHYANGYTGAGVLSSSPARSSPLRNSPSQRANAALPPVPFNTVSVGTGRSPARSHVNVVLPRISSDDENSPYVDDGGVEGEDPLDLAGSLLATSTGDAEGIDDAVIGAPGSIRREGSAASGKSGTAMGPIRVRKGAKARPRSYVDILEDFHGRERSAASSFDGRAGVVPPMPDASERERVYGAIGLHRRPSTPASIAESDEEGEEDEGDGPHPVLVGPVDEDAVDMANELDPASFPELQPRRSTALARGDGAPGEREDEPTVRFRVSRVEDTARRAKRFSVPAIALQTTPVLARTVSPPSPPSPPLARELPRIPQSVSTQDLPLPNATTKSGKGIGGRRFSLVLGGAGARAAARKENLSASRRGHDGPDVGAGTTKEKERGVAATALYELLKGRRRKGEV